MIIKQLLDEDFVNYKKPSMFIGFPSCTFKCEKECGEHCCQNSALAQSPDIDIPIDTLIGRYMNNPITKAVVCGGMEPLDSFSDLLDLISELRKHTACDCVIYTGYTKEELENSWFYPENRNLNTRRSAYELLKTFPNIIIKFGRFVPNQQSHYDEVLGVNLASPNQRAEKIS